MMDPSGWYEYVGEVRDVDSDGYERWIDIYECQACFALVRQWRLDDHHAVVHAGRHTEVSQGLS
jgi:hypothetical protein